MANFLDTFLSKFRAGAQTQSVLGIDIGASSIKVVQLGKKSGQAILQTYGEIALGPYAGTQIGRATKLDGAKLAEALRDVLKEANTSTTDSAMSIPLRSSMVSVFKMPKINEKQLADMIPIEARKYIPVPISEVALDWFVIPDLDAEFRDNKADDKPTIETMVVAIHNDVLADFSNIVGATGIKTTFFEIEMFSTARAVLDADYLTPVMIIDIGAGATKVYITERGIVRDSHIIGRGSQDLTLNIATSMNLPIDFAEKLKRGYGKNEPAQDKAISEMTDLVFNPIFTNANEVLLQFQKRYNKNVTKVILVGGGSLLAGIHDKAQGFFGIETISGTPFDKVQTPAFLEPVLKKNGVMFASAIGLAIRKLQEME